VNKLLYALGAAGAALVVAMLTRKGSGARVYRRERAAGVHPRLAAWLDEWERSGPFPIVVTGGGRTAADQVREYAKGRTAPGPHAGETGYPPLGQTVTDAETIKDSAHGARVLDGARVFCAVDVAPLLELTATGAVKSVDYVDRAKFDIIGRSAVAFGLEWGGYFPKYDGPHVQVASWRALPAPSAMGVA
jgi:hypothetical protein